MRTELETTRVVRSWLEDGRTRLPDSVLDSVLDQLPATRQRRSMWPARRIADMNLAAKGLLAAAAVVAVALIGFNLLPGVGVGPGPAAVATPSPSPVPTPTPSPTAKASPGPPALPSEGDLAAGTYRVIESQFTRFPFQITVPDGWKRDAANFVFKGPGSAAEAFDGNGVLLATWIVSHVYRDSCQWTGSLAATPTTDDVIRALAGQKGHETTGPTPSSIGGRPATRFELSVPADFDVSSCDGDQGLIRLWPDAGPNENYGLPINPGHRMTVYVVDVAGQPQVIVAVRKAGSSAADVAELDQVIGSLRFD